MDYDSWLQPDYVYADVVYETCLSCEGEGMVFNFEVCEDPKCDCPRMIECDSCDGNGEVEAEPCSGCGGVGFCKCDEGRD